LPDLRSVVDAAAVHVRTRSLKQARLDHYNIRTVNVSVSTVNASTQWRRPLAALWISMLLGVSLSDAEATRSAERSYTVGNHTAAPTDALVPQEWPLAPLLGSSNLTGVSGQPSFALSPGTGLSAEPTDVVPRLTAKARYLALSIETMICPDGSSPRPGCLP